MPNAPYWKPATRRDPDRGLDAALLAELAKKTGWTFEERPVSPADQCTALAEGEVDIILNGAAAALAGTPGLARPIVAVESKSTSHHKVLVWAPPECATEPPPQT